ncbi:MAG: GNAT family N-acetyltransferase [bacterium]|nr:GNAT family N-acetyltransferase [bacterium]
MGIKPTPPCVLSREHSVEDFDYGHPLLNTWLKRYAWQNLQANAAGTYVICIENEVVGFYSLAVGAIDHAAATARIKKGLARHPIPPRNDSCTLGDKKCQGMKIGKSLLKDAIVRTLHASQYAGIRAVLVHAKNDKAREFYERFGFEPSPLDPLQLMLLIKDAKKTIEDTLP